jgi:hypothetical protein
MQSPSWVALFRQIPANLQDALALLTINGAEIVIQKILRLDQDFLILRGRMAGTMDGGRVIILPYNQISNVAFNKRMTEPEVKAIFGVDETLKSLPTSAAALSPSEPTPVEEDAAEDVEIMEDNPTETTTSELNPPAQEPPSPAPDPNKPPQAHPSKSILLARLRARLSGGS